MTALLRPSPPPGERDVLHLRPARAALPQTRAEALIGSQANYEIKIKRTIYFYKIIKKITAGLTSIREVAALFSSTRITQTLNKDTFLSNNAVL